MTTWRITDSSDARDLRADTEAGVREKLAANAPAAPDFTMLRGPVNKFVRRFSSRNN